MFFANFIKAILFGIIEGITEWLPISSTGHLILADEFIGLKVSPEFMAMFNVVIQLGAILAVVYLYFHKLNPFSPTKNALEKRHLDTLVESDHCCLTICHHWFATGRLVRRSLL